MSITAYQLVDVAHLTRFLEHMQGEGYRIVRAKEQDQNLLIDVSANAILGARELRGLAVEYLEYLENTESEKKPC